MKIPEVVLPLWKKYFDIELFQPDNLYDKKHSVIMAYQYKTPPYQHLIDQGYKVVVDYTFDSMVYDPPVVKNNVLELRAQDWSLIHDSQVFVHANYFVPTRQSNPDKFFLMLMNLRKKHRDRIFEKVTPYLDSSLYSYVGRNIFINGDDPDKFSQEFFNPMWYEKTNFSLVVETISDMTDAYIRRNNNSTLFISEKIIKPIACQHPFIVYGCAGTLEYLRSKGFETFSHTIDETYDGITDSVARLEAISQVLQELYKRYTSGEKLFGDALSLEIVKHNYDRLFDAELIEKMFKDQLVTPVLEFLNSP
jgi:hypothetical protein